MVEREEATEMQTRISRLQNDLEFSVFIIARKGLAGPSTTILTSEAQTKKSIADIGISAPSAKLI